MIKIGITGGIGSGKSVVSELFETMGIPVYIADTESKRLTVSSPEIRASLVARFGEQLYAGNTLNKALLASFIFSDDENLKFVNHIIHPVVLNHFMQWTQNHTGIVAMEAAILFESGFYQGMDQIITVTAPMEIRLERVMQRDSTSREEVMKRINVQLPDEEKCKRSDFVIYNDDRQAIIPQVEAVLKQVSGIKSC